MLFAWFKSSASTANYSGRGQREEVAWLKGAWEKNNRVSQQTLKKRIHKVDVSVTGHLICVILQICKISLIRSAVNIHSSTPQTHSAHDKISSVSPHTDGSGSWASQIRETGGRGTKRGMEKRERKPGRKEPIPYMLPDMNKKDMRRYIALDRDLAIYGHRLLIGIVLLRISSMTTLTCKQLFPWQMNRSICVKRGNSGHLGCFQTCWSFAPYGNRHKLLQFLLGSVRFSTMITNVLRIRHCLLFITRIPIMNYNRAWFVGMLGWIAFIEFIFNQAEIPHLGDLGPFILMWIQVQLPCLYVPKGTKLREKMCQYLKRTSQMWKVLVHNTWIVLNYAVTKMNCTVGLNNALVSNEKYQTQPHATSLPLHRPQGLFSRMKKNSSRSHLSILILLVNTGFVASALPLLDFFSCYWSCLEW